MKLLSLDMSTRRTGWAVFDNEKLIAYNLIEIQGKETSERTTYMYDKIQELITSYHIDCIVCEDVPVSIHSDLDVGKNLCVLQGCLLAIAHTHHIKMYTLRPTAWRTEIGIHHTLYKCDTCNNSFEDISGLEFKICNKCGEKDKKKLHKDQINDRVALKERAVKMANDVFGTNLQYISKYSKKNQDDIAEAILVGYSYLKKENGDNGRKN
ncbi:MAG: hypothetical protein IJI98_11725 [Methanosphaera sp.]|nr:hypothetical protein [Methanosphaera sp.]